MQNFFQRDDSPLMNERGERRPVRPERSRTATNAKHTRRMAIMGGVLATLVGLLGFALHAALVVDITGWGQEPRPDAERLIAGLVAPALIGPIIAVGVFSAVIVGFGVAAIRDAIGAGTGAAAGRLWMFFGLATLGFVYACLKSGSWIALLGATIMAIGTYLNLKAWWSAHRMRTSREDDASSP